MTIWAEKEVLPSQWLKLQDQFEWLYISLRAPADIMLICANGDDLNGRKLVMSLPDERYLAIFDGFTKIDEENLPTKASLLCGNPNEFQQRFGFSADCTL